MILAAATAVAVAQEVGDARRGRAYAETHCAVCHGVSPGSGASPRPEVAPFATIARTPGMTALALEVWLQTPHRDMPNLIIPSADRDDIIAYILSLRRGEAR